MNDVSAGRTRLEQLLAAGQDRVWAVFYEDGYETMFGDGFYMYVAMTFANQAQALTWSAAERAHSAAYHLYVYACEIAHDDAGALCIGTLMLETVVGREYANPGERTLSVDEVSASLWRTEADPGRHLG